MLAAGVVVPALTQEIESDQQQKRKRPVYSNKKKKSSQNQNQSSLPPPPDTAKVLVSPPAKPKNVSSVKSVEPVSLKNNQDDQVKNSWDASSDFEDDQSKEEKIKESWDVSSEEEEIDEVNDSWDQESVQEPIPEKSKLGKTDGDKTGAAQKTQPSKQHQVQKKQEEEEEESDDEEEESSEEEEEEEDDSESDDEELTVAEKQELKRKEEAAARRQVYPCSKLDSHTIDTNCCILCRSIKRQFAIAYMLYFRTRRYG